MATKPFTVDGNIVVDEATLSNSTNSLVLPAGSIITGGGTVLDATNSDTSDLAEHVDYKYFTDTRARSAISATGDITYDSATGVISFTASAAPVTSVNTQTGAVVLDTDDIAEGTTNLYYTDARADARITASDTDALSEGTTNLYYTDARADARITAADTDALSEGSTNLYYTDARVDTKLAAGVGNITTSGYLRGPANFVIDPAAHGDDTGKVVIAGNLQVDGVQTTINSTIVSIDDLKLSVATDAADSAAANGAGITVGGANANITYTHATTSWDFDKPVNVAGNLGVTGTVDGVDIAARDAILTSTTTTADAALPKAGGTVTGDVIFNTKIGIGTVSPGYPLQVNGNVDILNVKGSLGNAFVRFTDGDATADFSMGADDGSGAGAGAFILYDRSNTAYRLVVKSNGYSGIGTSEPAELLHANGSIRLTTDVSTTRRLYALSGTGAYALNSSGGAAIAFHRDASNNDEIAFETHWQGNQHAERMRIDNQGNIGIGTDSPAGKLEVENTSVNYAILGTSNKGHYFESQSDDNTDGFEIYQQHGSTATRNSFIVNDNRTGSKSAAFEVRGNGNVIISNKNKLRFTDAGVDKAVLGIHTGTRLYMGSEGSNSDPRIRFNGETTQAAIEPALPSGATGSGASGYLDLGSSTSGFKDLYLDGGVYLGGTGSANHLDDYEEGTWTPGHANFTITGTFSSAGRYTKVGRMVTIQGWIKSTGSIAFGVSCLINGFPFAGAWMGGEAISYSAGVIAAGLRSDLPSSNHSPACYVDSANSRAFLSNFTTTAANEYMYINVVYYTA